MQENTHRVHANTLSPRQLAIDPLRIESVGLPHLQFVNGCCGNVVASHEPGLLFVPIIRFLLGPSLSLCGSGYADKTRDDKQQRDVSDVFESWN